MSIIIHIYYRGQNGAAKRFADDMITTGTAAAIRAEEGCEQYDYFFPMEDPETLLLIDRWKDQKALDRHHDSPMMKTITALRKKHDLHMRVERCLSEDTPIPTPDQAFIRE